MSSRPPSSRSKHNNATIPPRTRTVSSRVPDDVHNKQHKPSASSSSRPNTEPETNIQVVIRCRRRSQREIEENSPNIVNTEPEDHQVSIETTAPTSTLGVVTLPPTRTYPFDQVFGPEADQASIYHDVVSPLLEQVVAGYNCTLFAYGQTGTGKTYTMQGDLTPTPMGNPSIHAGMIPRVLFRLFHHLETSVADYSVKISYIELYNEELRDLLAPELASPLGSAQPMGKDKSVEAGLKIFDEPNKRGVFVQGVEEVSVRTSLDALALLTKGSDRRQIAATKFNDHSSRSHSIFTITVHIKEAGVAGDDLLKTGKLNLVDLAGSENIGRSGAENKRAREAGMINQSLLTLGRVINALVDKSPHIPYRESKLTRLLQESLGGKTKTCIIATISPARCNMEETLSTLDYALRAKSIRNKPELNQRMTRNSLLKEYVAEIERLKADLLAAREKNGIFFSEETWKEMENEKELRLTEIVESRKQVQIIENQMKVVREEFEQSIGLLMKRDAELKETRAKLVETQEALEEKKEELSQAVVHLEEEVVVRRAFELSEQSLNTIANDLSRVAHDGEKDVSGLFEKLERKSGVLSSNSHAVEAHGKKINAIRESLSDAAKQLLHTTSTATHKMQARAKQFEDAMTKALHLQSARIEQELLRIQETVTAIKAQGNIEADALKEIWVSIKDARSAVKSDNTMLTEQMHASLEQTFSDHHHQAKLAFSATEQAMKTTNDLCEGILRESLLFLDRERQTIVAAQNMVNETAAAEINRLREINENLNRTLEEEQVKSSVSQDQLIQQVSNLVADHLAGRDRRLREIVGEVQNANQASNEALGKLSTSHNGLLGPTVFESTKLSSTMKTRSSELKRTSDGALKSLTTARSTLEGGVSRLQGTICSNIETYSNSLQGHVQGLYNSASKGFERESAAKRARIEATGSLASNSRSQFESLGKNVASTSSGIQTFVTSVTSESAKVVNAASEYEGISETHLSALKAETGALFQDGTRVDASTGRTPRKRTWDYVDHWELTKPRSELLSAWRAVSDAPSGIAPSPTLNKGVEDDMGVEDPMEGSDCSPESPSASSLASSGPSLVLTKGGKSIMPSNGPPLLPLQDARNVYTTRGPRRRR